MSFHILFLLPIINRSILQLKAVIREVLARIDPADFDKVVGPEELANLLFKNLRVDIEDESTHDLYVKLRTSVIGHHIQRFKTRTGLESARVMKIRMRADTKKKKDLIF